jgi:hypothetical protein
MLDFLSKVIDSVVSLGASVLIAVGIVSIEMPAPIVVDQDPVVQEQTEVDQNSDPVADDTPSEPAAVSVDLSPAPNPNLGNVFQAFQPVVPVDTEPTPVATATLTPPPVETTTPMVEQTPIPPTQTAIVSSAVVQPPVISNVNVTAELTAATIQWDTDKVSESKIFVSGKGISPKVYNSNAGSGTRHLVRVTDLRRGTEYSYEIEAVIHNKSSKKFGSFFSKADEYTVSVDPRDTLSVPATGWNGVVVDFSVLKNGIELAHEEVIIETPDTTQNETRDTNAVTGRGGTDWHGNYTYYPKTVGNHTITFTWGDDDVTASINVAGTQPINAAPTVDDYVNEDPVIEVNDTNTIKLGEFKVAKADERVGGTIGDIVYETDFRDHGFVELSQYGPTFTFRIKPKKDSNAIAPGKYAVTVTGMKVNGVSSGQRFDVTGLPINFTFEIEDIPDLEIIQLKTEHTFYVPDYVNEGDPINYPATNDIQGEIGSFKIKLKPDSRVNIVDYEVRIEGSDAYLGSLKANGGSEMVTDSSGVTQESVSLRVYLKQAPRSQVREDQHMDVYIDRLVVEGGAFRTTKSISGPISFDFDIVR